MNRWHCRFESRKSFTLNLRIVTKTLQPDDVWLSAEPRHLALGVIAVRLLRGLDRLLASQLAIQKLDCLFVA